jgi:palmitoyltransferase
MPRRPATPSQKLWEASNAEVQRSVNKWSARIVPLILICVVGYSVWAIVVVLCLHYLIYPPADVPRRTGAGIAIIVIYFLLMVPMSVAYFRVLQSVAMNPGFVPRPGEGEKNQKKAARKRQRRLDNIRSNGVDGVQEEKVDVPYARSQASPESQDTDQEWTGPAPGLEFYYQRDIFECEKDGRPRWCSTCHIWKPDRVHHSSELGKCVFKMDHFCPWYAGTPIHDLSLS